MMRTRVRGGKLPCEACGTLTQFDYDVRGPRGSHVRYAPMCPGCGERPDVRDKALAKTAA